MLDGDFLKESIMLKRILYALVALAGILFSIEYISHLTYLHELSMRSILSRLWIAFTTFAVVWYALCESVLAKNPK